MGGFNIDDLEGSDLEDLRTNKINIFLNKSLLYGSRDEGNLIHQI